jgi:hypothetical protein
MKIKGWTQQQLGDAVAEKHYTISRWLQGVGNNSEQKASAKCRRKRSVKLKAMLKKEPPAVHWIDVPTKKPEKAKTAEKKAKKTKKTKKTKETKKEPMVRRAMTSVYAVDRMLCTAIAFKT